VTHNVLRYTFSICIMLLFCSPLIIS